MKESKEALRQRHREGWENGLRNARTRRRVLSTLVGTGLGGTLGHMAGTKGAAIGGAVGGAAGLAFGHHRASKLMQKHIDRHGMQVTPIELSRILSTQKQHVEKTAAMNKHEAFWDGFEKTALQWKIPKDVFKRGAGGVQKAIKTTGVVKKVGEAVSKITTKAKPYAQTVRVFNSMR